MEERIFTEMVWGFSVAWVLLAAVAVLVQIRGRRATRNLERLKREVAEQTTATALHGSRGHTSA